MTHFQTGTYKGEAVLDLKKLQAQQALTERPGEPPPANHGSKIQMGLADVHWSCAVGTRRGARSAQVITTADISELQAVKVRELRCNTISEKTKMTLLGL